MPTKITLKYALVPYCMWAYCLGMCRKPSHIFCILISYDCCVKLTQTWWLNAADIYSLTVPYARSLKPVSLGQNQGVGRAILPLNALKRWRGWRVWPLPASTGCQHSLAYVHITSILGSKQYCLLPFCIFLIRTLVIAFRVHLDNTG